MAVRGLINLGGSAGKARTRTYRVATRRLPGEPQPKPLRDEANLTERPMRLVIENRPTFTDAQFVADTYELANRLWPSVVEGALHHLGYSCAAVNHDMFPQSLRAECS
jgi:hypothetical protein